MCPHISLGANEDGTLTGIKIDAVTEAIGEDPGARTAPHLYATPNLYSSLLITNGMHLPTATILRAPGEEVGSFALECAMDELATKLDIDPVERDEPVILHGPIGALHLEERYEIHDPRVLFAIRWHTPGHPDYDSEAWAMFIADKVDPHKVERWPALQEVADIASSDIG